MFPLKRDSRNELVRQMQFGLGIITDGIFGPNTESALKDWQKNLSIPPTGKMTKNIWNSLFQPLELQDEKHLLFAKSLLHVREEDIDLDGVTDNRGEIIDIMVKSVWDWWEPKPDKEGPPWCAIFISYCLHASYGFEFESPRVKEWKDWLDDRGNATELDSKTRLKKNTIYIGGYLNSSGYGHIFFVDPIRSLQNNEKFTLGTIEGNTNDDGSREGDGVYERLRKLNKYWVYGLPIPE